ncbi:hypothetical protein FRB97_003852, partial [Tulasnella sp. 331]
RIMFPSLRALDLDQEVIHTYVLASSLLPSLTTLVARSFDDDDAMASHVLSVTMLLPRSSGKEAIT